VKAATTGPTPATSHRIKTLWSGGYVLQAQVRSDAQTALRCAASATAFVATRADGTFAKKPRFVPCFLNCSVPCFAHHLARFLTVLALLVSGCHVRTQEFHCKLEADRKTDFEFAMSPTQARYLDEVFTFTAERANQRLYRHASGRELVFDLSAMQLAEYGAPPPSKSTSAERPLSPSAALPSNDPSGSAQPTPWQEAKDEQFAFLRAHPPLRRWICERYRIPGGS
jgi:hypothetical protein